VQSSPAIGADGTIYVGSNDGHLYAINAGGSQKWKFPSSDSIGAVKSSPAIGTDGTIYIGSDDGNMYALNQTGTQKAGWPVDTAYTNPQCINASPCLSTLVNAKISLGRPAIASDGTIYYSAFNTGLYARNPDGTEKWTVSLGPSSPGSDNDYMPGVDTVAGFGYIYTDVPGNALAALNPADGFEIWRVGVDSDIDSTPVVGPDGTIYFGTDNAAKALFAIDPNTRSEKWPRFVTGGQVDNIPALNPDGSEVYVVSNDGNLYAVNTADGEELWRFPIPVNPSDGVANSSPAVGADGTVYVGSTDSNLYAVGLPSEPRNIREKLIKKENDSIVTVDDEKNWLNGSSLKGPWAVRLEVDRCPSKNINAAGECLPDGDGKLDYELRLWMKQCINAACDNLYTADDPFPDDDPFFRDTRIDYRLTLPPDLTQTFKIDSSEFSDFLFGFTAGAAAGEELEVTITNFTLSFIRLGDPIIDLPEF
jgi:outer membrane protein assembly factor BamB